MKKIVLVTDAWHPQINGVVTTLNRTIGCIRELGNEVSVISPMNFNSFPCPTYPEISLSLVTPGMMEKRLASIKPQCIHIATEGPLGWAARKVCKKYGFGFSTSYHTKFPEYVRLRVPIPLALSYSVLRRFHRAAGRTMVATKALKEELASRGFSNIALWSRGVDTNLFRPGREKAIKGQSPVFMFVGRVAVEKNIESFLKLNLPGSKYVVGDGPAKEELSRKYPEVNFVGYKKGIELASYIASADVFVFPSLTDTFGLVMLEAMASGVPVAAYPVTGPVESIVNGVNGYMDNDLEKAATQALEVSPESCREYALKRSWERSSRQFFSNLIVNELSFGATSSSVIG